MFTLRKEELSFVERAPMVAQEAVVVDAAASRVWPAFAEASAWTEWFASVRTVRYTSPEPHGMGSTRFVHVGGFKVHEEILAFDVNERFAFCVVKANLPLLKAMVEVITLTPAGDGTRVTYRQALDPQPWIKPVLGRFRRQLQRDLQAGLAGLGPWLARRP
ncbi:MAG: SRPBCC family protein [Acidimicrobiales bacterium]